jgi:hypothetical protein
MLAPLTKMEGWKMALYCTMGIRNSMATIANFGEKSDRHWAGAEADARKDRKELKAEGFDASTKQFGCPQDKKALLALLNSLER